MRKLSIMMVVALLLTTFAAMFVVPASAATATPAVPDSVTQIALGNDNVSYRLYTYASDAEAAADGAIGRFAKEGSNGYAKAWSAVGGNAQSCGSNVFLLITDIDLNNDLDTERTRIDNMDLGGSGRSLIIDGSLGQARTGEMAGKNFEIKSTDRVFHYGGKGDTSRNADSAFLTFQNITITCTGAAAIQINSDLTLTLGEGCVINGGASYCVVAGQLDVKEGDEIVAQYSDAKIIIDDGSTLNPKGQWGVYSVGPDQQIIFNDCVVNAGRAYQNTVAGNTVTVNGGTFNSTAAAGRADTYVFALKNATNFTMNGGTVNMDNTGPYGAIMCEGAGSEVTINGGTFNFVGVTNQHCAIVCARVKTDIVVNNATATGNASVASFITAGGTYADNSTVVINNATAERAINAQAGVGLNMTVNGGTYTSANKDIFYWTYTTTSSRTTIEATPSVLNINGGTFTATGVTQLLNIRNDGNGKGKNVNIYGGNFVSDNTDELTWGTGTTVGGAIYLSAGQTNIYGGNFTIDNEMGFMINAWAGGNNAKIYGGNFVGGTAAAYFSSAVMEEGAIAGYELFKTVATGNYYIATNRGAALRTVIGEAGLRFESTVSADFVKLAGEDAMFGTLIVPVDYLEATNGVFTKAALDAAGKTYVEQIANKGLVENEDGSLTLRVALVDIKEGNKNRAFVAIAFAIVDGVYVYAQEASAERSVDYVAKAALADVKAAAEGVYTTEVSSYYVNNEGTFTYTEGKAYSKYTADQLTAIKSCVFAG